VSDAERDAVGAILRRDHVAGRLDNEEFEERLTSCLAAKTYADLDALIVDLQPEESAQRGASWSWRRLPLPLVFLPLIVLVAYASHGRAFWLVPLIFFFVVRPVWRGHRPHSRIRGRF
jgi:hypothetical protein